MKVKAVFMAFIIVFSILSIADFTSAEQQACCEVTKEGEYCRYTAESECAANALKSYAVCEQTEFCKTGCCYNSNEGNCYKNVPKARCNIEEGSTWSSDPNCDIPQCSKGCCILSNQCSFVTQTRCKKETSKFPYVSMKFESEIGSEGECTDQCRLQEKGCCVSETGCVFTSREACDSEFNKDTLCSNDKLDCDCAKLHHTGCKGENVYWFDSCNNPENIYNSDKRIAYNAGYVLKEEDSCVASADDPNCGNCDYSEGNFCGKTNVNMADGDYGCNSLSCADVYENEASPNSGGDKESGESWCIYDARVGFGQDVVGSRHYRHLCINGEEIIEPCRDFREEFCVQGVSGEEPVSDLGQAFAIHEGYVEAACRGNRFEDCSSCLTKECCDDIYNKDCYWMPSTLTAQGGTCIPMVPPGIRFWESSSEPVCEKANQECKVTFTRAGIGLIGGRDWECIQNCHCLKKEWVVAAHNLCKAQGDCGAYYNIAGRLTTSGFSEDTKYKLTKTDIEDWETISTPSKKKDDPYSTGEFFKRTWPALLLILGTGLYTEATGSVGFGEGLVIGLGWLYGRLFSTQTMAKQAGKLISTFYAQDTTVTTTQLLTSAYAEEIGVAQSEFLAKTAEGVFEDPTVFSAYYDNYFYSLHETGVSEAVARGIGEEAAANLAEDKAVESVARSYGLTPTTEEGVFKVASKDGFTLIQQPTTIQHILAALQTLAWIYTIYSLLDVLLADTKTEHYTVTCSPWEAPDGGRDCEKCNEEGKVCSEYRCKSLGKLCSLINQGSENETCVNLSPYDVNAPIIRATKSKEYTIAETPSGYTINEKIEPFTPVTIGISTDEPSQCKFSLNSSIEFDNLEFNFGSTLFLYNHSMTFSLPSELATEQALTLTNGGRYTLYLRCKDAAGNKNKRDYYIKFQIKPGPDLTPPTVELTSVINNAYIPANLTAIALDVYVNEPAMCKWSDRDTDYNIMENTMTCTDTGFDPSSFYYGLYKCSTILTGIEPNRDNNFYFRCLDYSNNLNKQSYKYTLRSTVPLVIDSVKPSGKVYDSSPLLTAETVRGAEAGKAICGYSIQDINLANMPQFLYTNSTMHEQPLTNLTTGKYTYYITCVDRAGNIAQDKTEFDVAVDVTPPRVTRIYKDTALNILHISTSEISSCEYADLPFTYGAGMAMTNQNSKDHEANLVSNILHIICSDLYNNQAKITVYP